MLLKGNNLSFKLKYFQTQFKSPNQYIPCSCITKKIGPIH